MYIYIYICIHMYTYVYMAPQPRWGTPRSANTNNLLIITIALIIN